MMKLKDGFIEKLSLQPLGLVRGTKAALKEQMHRCIDAEMHSPNNVKDYASMPPCLYASKRQPLPSPKNSPLAHSVI